MTAPSQPASSSSTPFDIVASYRHHLKSELLPPPIAAINALIELLSHPSTSLSTVSELIELISNHSSQLKTALPNPIPATAGTDLFARFVVALDWREDERASGNSFQGNLDRLIRVATEYCEKTVPDCRARICQRANVFIKEGSVILTHSYSRVIMEVLRTAAAQHNNSISVYVTESRPSGLGLKTHRELTKAGIPSTLVLDTAAAYCMSRVDLCLVGSEGVAESGGLFNAVGTYTLALVAKALGKPFYAAAESYKFLRLFPLSQSDLPMSHPILPFPTASQFSTSTPQPTKEEPSTTSSNDSRPKIMSKEQESLNPEIDYTPPDLVTAILSDVGVLTPGGVADALLLTYGGG